MVRIAWHDVELQHKVLNDPKHRLRWAVDFAFCPWVSLSTGLRMEQHAGLLAFAPESAVWDEDKAESESWPDEHVLMLQSRLQLLFTAVAQGIEPVVLTSYPMRLTWRPHDPQVRGLFRRYASGPVVDSEGSGGMVLCEHADGLNGVELVVLYTALLLWELPDSIAECQAPRSSLAPGTSAICGKIFYARTNRKWCGAACSIRWRRALLET